MKILTKKDDIPPERFAAGKFAQTDYGTALVNAAFTLLLPLQQPKAEVRP